ncbi:hypothetical protein [Cupriavidus pauculus]|uniref:hypothetical protein n=1 Tax=Cupriavidus pauculus TaxID=82633 RepID=UPI0011AF5019|nr:hypothetical protein [Cupriavidus pauculus]
MTTAPASIPDEPPNLRQERVHVWRVLGSFQRGSPFWLLTKVCRLPAGTVRRALRQLTADGDVIAESGRGEIRYRIA